MALLHYHLIVKVADLVGQTPWRVKSHGVLCTRMLASAMHKLHNVAAPDKPPALL